jgi:hypothetical protein
MNKHKVSKRKAVNYGGAIIISLILIISVLAIAVPTGLSDGGSCFSPIF